MATPIVHPGMTVVSIVYLVLIIVGIEKNISGILGLGILALIFGSIAVGYPVHTAE
jgi:preprotein translocase subunit SecF